MTDERKVMRPATRVTCMVHSRLGREIAERLAALQAPEVLVENARCERQRLRARRWGLPGRMLPDESPMEIYRTTVPPEATRQVLAELTDAARLDMPGRGSLFAQDIEECADATPPAMESDRSSPSRLLHDLAMLTAILSMPGSGERVARIALRLGACVPVISLGEGTGIRDRMGLLRITIPPEKEIVHMMVPRHDAGGIERLLIEEAGMDRPGGGFMYRTPIRAGLADPMLRIGRQESAASLEQIIAAMDELKAGTAWRRRYADPDRPDAGQAERGVLRPHREIVFVCPEGQADRYVQAAVRAGAGGVTVSRVRCVAPRDAVSGDPARERGVLCVPVNISERILMALQNAGCPLLQALDVPAVFSHQRRTSG